MRFNFELGGFALTWAFWRYDMCRDSWTLATFIITRKYIKHYGLHVRINRPVSFPFDLYWAWHRGEKYREYALSLPVRRVS